MLSSGESWKPDYKSSEEVDQEREAISKRLEEIVENLGESLGRHDEAEVAMHAGSQNEIPVLDDPDEYSEEEINRPNEEDIMRDTKHPRLYLTKMQRSRTTKAGKHKKLDRVYNSRHACLYGCRGLFLNFSQHVLSKKHKNEEVVQKVLEMDIKCGNNETRKKDKKERSRLLDQLMNKADHVYNQQVIDRHQAVCPMQSENGHASKGNLLLQSSVIVGHIPDKASTALQKEVYPIMRADEIGMVARTDTLIITLETNGCCETLATKS